VIRKKISLFARHQKTMWQHHPEKAHLHVMTKEVNAIYSPVAADAGLQHQELPELGKRITLLPYSRRVPCSCSVT